MNNKLKIALEKVLSGEIKLTTDEELIIRSIIEKRENERKFQQKLLELSDGGELCLNEKELSYFK